MYDNIKKTPNLILIRIETKKLPRYHSNSRYKETCTSYWYGL